MYEREKRLERWAIIIISLAIFLHFVNYLHRVFPIAEHVKAFFGTG